MRTIDICNAGIQLSELGDAVANGQEFNIEDVGLPVACIVDALMSEKTN